MDLPNKIMSNYKGYLMFGYKTSLHRNTVYILLGKDNRKCALQFLAYMPWMSSAEHQKLMNADFGVFDFWFCTIWCKNELKMIVRFMNEMINSLQRIPVLWDTMERKLCLAYI